jgi:sphingosine kinase
MMVKDTTRQGHAFDIAKALPFNYDAVVVVSGDGLVHEVMNGFANHPEPKKAFAIPVAPIPTGSGNGLALNLLGAEVLSTSFIIINNWKAQMHLLARL